jgi:2-C-methyl-D-erythritol 4-phosphate cytidylyltransferase
MLALARIALLLVWVPAASSFLPPLLPARATSGRVQLAAAPDDVPSMADVGIILLAGGTGSRMKASMPKQFLELGGVPVLHHSLDLFLERLPDYLRSKGRKAPSHVVLVMDPSYQPDYQDIVDRYTGRLVFAKPGKERQGSGENGISKLVEVSFGLCTYAAIHDSARPLVTVEEVVDVVRDAKNHGAAVLGVPCKATIKETDDGITVLRTIPRERLWEVHTPQVIRMDLLEQGFAKVRRYKLEVTDDVSIIEQLGETVKLTRGEYTNLKITTPEDMNVAEAILRERKSPPVNMLSKPITPPSTKTKNGYWRKLQFWRKKEPEYAI